MSNPTSGFPDCAVGIQPSPDSFRPYDHQQAAWDAMDRHFTEKGKQAGILVVPTGGGKTAIAARWLLRGHVRQGGRVLWLSHRRGLLKQAFDAFTRVANLAAPRDRLRLVAVSGQDRHWRDVSSKHDIVFSTIQSAAQQQQKSFLDQLEHQSPKGLFVVVDEAHHAAAPSYQQVLNLMEELGCPVLGLTATPVRMDPGDDRRLWKIFQFRQRERRFTPSKAAIEDAVLRSIQPGRDPEAWYALADQFLGTFEQHYAPAHGGAKAMTL